MPNLNKNEKNRLFMTLDKHTEQNEKIERGLYGDQQNKVKGLIERVETIERWIMQHNIKTAYISGITAAVIVMLKVGWDWICSRMKP
jgi:hypothetical protein